VWHHELVIALLQVVLRLLADLLALASLVVKPRRTTAAEILILRRQLAVYKEHGIKPGRIDAATRISLALLSRLCDWRACLSSAEIAATQQDEFGWQLTPIP